MSVASGGFASMNKPQGQATNAFGRGASFGSQATGGRVGGAGTTTPFGRTGTPFSQANKPTPAATNAFGRAATTTNANKPLSTSGTGLVGQNPNAKPGVLGAAGATGTNATQANANTNAGVLGKAGDTKTPLGAGDKATPSATPAIGGGPNAAKPATTPAAGGGLLAGKTNTPLGGAAGSGAGRTNLLGSTTQQPQIVYNSIQWPSPIAVPVNTAAPFFIPSDHQIQFSNNLISNKKTSVKSNQEAIQNYNILFETTVKDIEADLDIPDIQPIKVTAQQMQCGVPSNSPYSFPKNQIPHKINIYPPPSKGVLVSGSGRTRFEREGFGSIDYFSPIDYTSFDINSDIKIDTCYVDVYPIKSKIMKEYDDEKEDIIPTKSLNQEALITLYKVWPRDPITSLRSKDSDQNGTYEQSLRDYCSKKNLIFIDYDKEAGQFLFMTKDFKDGPFQLPDY